MRVSFIYFILLIIGVNCTERRAFPCEFKLIDLDSCKAPFLRKISSSENDLCSFRGDFSLNHEYYQFTGKFYRENNGIYLDFDSLVTNDIRYFDFNAKEGNSYSVTFKLVSRESAVQQIKVDKIYRLIRNNGNDDVYSFRVVDGFKYESERSDIVFFVTADNVVIGSYVSEFGIDGNEWVVLPCGDILRDQIDYSQKTFGVIE